jgi:hypothetical protein
MADFPSIRPDEIAKFTFDFAGKLGTEVIVGIPVWTCVVSPNSPVADPTPAARIVSSPIVSGQLTSVFCGTMIDGVVYTLTAEATGNGGSTVADSGDVECTIRSVPVSLVLAPEEFREEFPVFENETFYPNAQVVFWIATAKLFLDEARWSDWYSIGLRLFVAHQLSLERQNYLTSRRGNPAVGVGPANSRSVGGVSVSYDFSMGLQQGAGYWNLTLYGQRFYDMMEMVGAGPVQF